MRKTESSIQIEPNHENFSRTGHFVRWFKRGIGWRLDIAIPQIGKLLGPIVEERLVFRRDVGYFPHLRHPRTFNEKICNRKLFRPLPQAAMLADKFAVRQYVAERGCESTLNNILLHTTDPDQIDFAKLPQRFVVKATHGSGWNIIVRNKDEVSPEEIIRTCRKWIGSVFGKQGHEYHYGEIPPAILIEEFLCDIRYDVPLDYKFFVFHGKCHYIQVDYNRFTGHSRTIYNRRWEAQEFSIKYLRKIVEAEKPATLERMLEIAEALAQGIDFCRVDLYSLNDRDVYFGEMTLTPEAGYARFSPTAEGDFLMGSLW